MTEEVRETYLIESAEETSQGLRVKANNGEIDHIFSNYFLAINPGLKSRVQVGQRMQIERGKNGKIETEYWGNSVRPSE